MTKVRLFLAMCAILALAAPVHAQVDDEFGGGDDFGDGEPGMGDSSGFGDTSDTSDTGMADTGTTDTAAADTGGAEPSGGTAHDATVGDWGFQITGTEAQIVFADDGTGGVTIATAALPLIGVRKWGTRDTGWEAGGTLAFTSFGGPEAKQLLFGGTFGYMKAIGIHKSMVVYWEPQGTFLMNLPDSMGVDDPTLWQLAVDFNIGMEARLTFFGFERVGFTAKLGAGFVVQDVGDDINFGFSTGALQSSLSGLLSGSIGFVWYM
jgi:hypothetical protein